MRCATRPELCALVLAFILPSSIVQAQVQDPLPVPSAEEQKKIVAELRDLFKASYALRDRKSRAALANKLTQEADRTSNNKPSSRFVFLAEARDLWAEAMDLEKAFSLISRLSQDYDLGGAGTDVETMKYDVLRIARRAVKTKEDLRLIAVSHLEIARERKSRAYYDLALKAVKEAESAARPTRDRKLTYKISRLKKEIQSLKKEFGDIRMIELSLSIDPSDPDANLAMGRYLC